MDRIDVFAVARNRAQWGGRIALADMPRLCASLTDGPGDRAATLAYHCRGGIDAQGRPELELCLDAVLPLRCDRCAQKLALVLETDRRFYFVATQEELAAIPIDDTPEEALLGSAHFDLATLIEDEVILQLPISPRHPDCSPALHGTGAQRAAAAAAPAAERPHPFAGLAALRGRLPEPAGPGAGAEGSAGAAPDGPGADGGAPAGPPAAKRRPKAS